MFNPAFKIEWNKKLTMRARNASKKIKCLVILKGIYIVEREKWMKTKKKKKWNSINGKKGVEINI